MEAREKTTVARLDAYMGLKPQGLSQDPRKWVPDHASNTFHTRVGIRGNPSSRARMKHPTCRVVAYQMNACAKGDLFSDANVQSEGLIPDATSHMGLKRHGLGRGSLLDRTSDG